jgi:hypothetical protein
VAFVLRDCYHLRPHLGALSRRQSCVVIFWSFFRAFFRFFIFRDRFLMSF